MNWLVGSIIRVIWLGEDLGSEYCSILDTGARALGDWI